jgi:hypothetical protein
MARIQTSDIEIEIDDHLVVHPECYLVWVEAVRRQAA